MLTKNLLMIIVIIKLGDMKQKSNLLNLRNAAKIVAALGVLGVGLGLTACGQSADLSEKSAKPVIAVTTSILGDVTQNIVGEEAEVVVLMPAGSDPHNYQPSTKDVSKMMSADLIVENGLGLEEGLSASLNSARVDGIEILTVGDHIEPLAVFHDEESDHDDHDDHGHDDHDHGPLDPHFWHDPARMILAAEVIANSVSTISSVDSEIVTANAQSYSQELLELDLELQEIFAAIPAEKKKMVTGHRVFGYLADRYDLEIISSIVPTSSTVAEVNAATLHAISEDLKEYDLRAVFTDASQPQKVAETIIKETGLDIEVVALHSESLTPAGGEADTYLEMMLINAENIASALK